MNITPEEITGRINDAIQRIIAEETDRQKSETRSETIARLLREEWVEAKAKSPYGYASLEVGISGYEYTEGAQFSCHTGGEPDAARHSNFEKAIELDLIRARRCKSEEDSTPIHSYDEREVA